MTLEEAVAVLNRERHDGIWFWEAQPNAPFGPRAFAGIRKVLSAFEAVAIAEKYERGGRSIPEPINDWRNSIDPIGDPERYAERVRAEKQHG